MITLDAIRTAISAPDPFTQMDRLVREEMATGRKVKEIFAALKPLVDTVLDTPGLTEDGEEAFLGTLDGLMGNCRREHCYFDPPTVPIFEEIAKLPRWARVAFAARCARRVLPLLRQSWPDALDQHARTVSDATDIAEQTAAITDDTHHAASYSAADYAFSVTTSPGSTSVARFVADAAGSAARAAGRAADDDTDTALHNASASYAENAADFAVQAASEASFHDQTVQAIHRDFTHLGQRAQYERWDDNTPVPPEFFGPLWPEGAPPGWPDLDTPRHTELDLEIVAGEQVIDRIVEDQVVNLFNALNRYHIARGGSPLTLEELWPYLNPSLVPEEV